MADTPARRMYRVSEAAALLGIGVSTAYEIIARGEIPTIRLGRRIMISPSTLHDLLGEAPPPPETVRKDLDLT